MYIPNDVQKANPSMFAAAVQARMAQALGVPATKHAAEDVALCLQAQRMKMPLETGILESIKGISFCWGGKSWITLYDMDIEVDIN